MSRKSAFFSLLVACVAILAASTAVAQPGQGRPGGGFGGFGGGNNDLALLNSEAIQKELEMSEDQIEDVKKLQTKSSEMMREMFSGFRDIPREEREEKMAEMRTKMEESMKEINADLGDVLLKPQQKRLSQVKAQLAMRTRGRGGRSSTGLLSQTIIDELDISEEQQDEIREKAEELQKELEEKVAKLRAEMQDELLGVLDKNQREQYEELVGDPFDVESAFQRGPGGGGFGQGGGRPGGGRQGGGRGQGNQRPESEDDL